MGMETLHHPPPLCKITNNQPKIGPKITMTPNLWTLCQEKLNMTCLPFKPYDKGMLYASLRVVVIPLSAAVPISLDAGFPHVWLFELVEGQLEREVDDQRAALSVP